MLEKFKKVLISLEEEAGRSLLKKSIGFKRMCYFLKHGSLIAKKYKPSSDGTFFDV